MDGTGRRVRIGIALSGGASHGWAHIGVLRRLAAAGIEPEIVAGCSAGALVGAYYAAGMLDRLESWVRALTVRRTFAYLRLRRGRSLFGGKLFREMGEHFRGIDVADLPVRFAAVATDLATGSRRLLVTGSVTRAVAASAAFPALFPPVKVSGAWAIDGCFSDPVPATLCRALGADVVIAVEVLGSAGDGRCGAELGEDGVATAAEGAARARRRLRRRVRQRLRRAFARVSRSEATPGMVAMALRSTLARERAQRAMNRSLRSADVVIAPALGRLRLGADAAVWAISVGYRTAAAHIGAIAGAARPRPSAVPAGRAPALGEAAVALAPFSQQNRPTSEVTP